MLPTDLEPYRRRRNSLLDQLGPEDAVLLPTGAEALRNGDTEHRFRPGSGFLYLTGFEEPDSILLLLPAHEESRSVLFLRERDPERETWTGRRLGVERAPEALGVDLALDIAEFDTKLPELLRGRRSLYSSRGLRPELDSRVDRLLGAARRRPKMRYAAPEDLRHLGALLDEMRLHKDAGEIALLRRAVDITVQAHRALVQAMAPGVHEYELEALLHYEFRRRGAVGPSYPSIVAGGDNATILHYVENDRPLVAGELLLVDAGAEYRWYAADLTRTWPVDGRFSGASAEIYDLVLSALAAGISHARPGETFESLHRSTLAVLVDGMRSLRLLEGSRDEILESGSYRKYFPHKSSHWLGLDVHDAGSYYQDTNRERPFAPGMVFTIEPGLYVPKDDPQAPPALRGIGVRIEDDLWITDQGHEVLTEAAPKTRSAVEDWCGAEAR